MYRLTEVAIPNKLGSKLDPYLFSMPADMRIEGITEIIKKIWNELKQKYPKKKWTNLKQQIGKSCKISDRTFDAYLKGQRTPQLGVIEKLFRLAMSYDIKVPKEQEILEKCTFKFGQGNSSSCSLPLHLTAKLAYLLGALRDGTLCAGKKYEISFYQKDTRWFSIIKNCIKGTFQPTSKILVFENRKNSSPKLSISSRPIIEFINRVCGVPLHNKIKWGTPEIIKEARWEIQKFYIRGYFDADGRTSYKYQKIGFCQASPESLHDIKEMLEKNNIQCRNITKYKHKGKKHPMFSLYVKTAHIDNFIKRIGSSNPQKFERLPLGRTERREPVWSISVEGVPA